MVLMNDESCNETEQMVINMDLPIKDITSSGLSIRIIQKTNGSEEGL